MFSWESMHSVKVGGISPHVSELSYSLAKMGHEVHVFTRAGNFTEYENIKGVHYQRVKHEQSGGIVEQMDAMCNAMYERYNVVKDLFGEFDVLHGHDWHPVNVLVRIGKEEDKPFVLTYHSTEYGRNGNVFAEWWEAKEISRREWLAGYEASQIIVTSERLKNEVQWLYQIPEYKMNIVPNAIFEGKTKRNLDPGKVKKKYGLHPFAPVILFVGRMAYQKGPDILVRAVPLVLDVHWGARFVLIGEGEMRMHCEWLAQSLGVGDACLFLGYCSEGTKYEWLNACDVVAVPSRNEPFGIIVLEAWDAEKPVVATEAVPIIDNFKTGILCHPTPESFAWGIKYALGDLLQTKELGKAGRRLIHTVYSWENVSKETLNVYRKL
jgi:glycosyltransferase involved in cell wall biosynthesis